jgi:adenylate cyclase
MANEWLTTRAAGRHSGARPIERPLRLATGLVLFAFATSHFLGHAFGIRSVEAMEAARIVVLKPWQTFGGLLILYTCFLTHLGLGLYALYRRRHLRIPASERWQLALGLAIPLLVIPHAANIRLGTSFYGMEFGYPRIIYNFFVISPDWALPRQLILLVTLWLHGCIGLRAWLSSKPWYDAISAALASVATLVPVLAILGVVNAGLDMREAAARDARYAARYHPPQAGTLAAQSVASLGRVTNSLLLIYLGLVAGTFALRAARDSYAGRFRALRISYPDGRVVTVPRGFSVLEASRWAGIPHASVCGGRGRCSTCRVRIVAGAEALAQPNPMERTTLARIGAPENVRLACQIRPAADLAVEPLVQPSLAAASDADRFAAAAQGGAEIQIAAMFVDLRQSTRLAAGRLPYDALFLFDRYIQAVTGPIRENGGHVTSIAGDGIMSMFGADGNPSQATMHGLKSALELWSRVEQLNHELGPELESSLRIGIGIHVGVAVVGWLHDTEVGSLQFLGDVGNVAAKLEDGTKQLDCTLVVSLEALDSISPLLADKTTRAVVAVAGKQEPVPVAVFKARRELSELVAIFP